MSRCSVRAVVAGVLALWTCLADAQTPQSSLTGIPQIRRVYQAILDARFDRARGLIAEACNPAVPGGGRQGAPAGTRDTDAGTGDGRLPAAACAVLDLVTSWWQIQLDPHNTAPDTAFLRRSEETIAVAEAGTRREPESAEAWFYLGAAYGARAQFEGLRGERLAAARNGARIKESLERALAIDPALSDARLGVGLYRYYADVAPAAARLLRWLLLLPGGDRARGLREMLEARETSQVLREEADYQLHQIYLWYEQDVPRALQILATLHETHPSNPLFLQRIAEIEDAYLSDHAASLETWTTLLDAAQAGGVAERPLAETRARIGLAQELDHLFETDAAIEQLQRVVAAAPLSPYGSAAQAHLLLAQALDRVGRREEALAMYRTARAIAPGGDPHDVVRQANAGLRRAPPPATALAYRLSLDGRRALERGDLDAAAGALERALRINPEDQVAHYRLARLLDARGELREAIDRYEHVMSAATTPPAFFADAALDAARLYEHAGDRARAIELYERARASFGGRTMTRQAAARALERLNVRRSRTSRQEMPAVAAASVTPLLESAR